MAPPGKNGRLRDRGGRGAAGSGRWRRRGDRGRGRSQRVQCRGAGEGDPPDLSQAGGGTGDASRLSPSRSDREISAKRGVEGEGAISGPKNSPRKGNSCSQNPKILIYFKINRFDRLQ